MAIKTYNCTSLTGGGVRALDALLVANLGDGDRAHVITADGFYVFEFDATATAAESSPDVIRPDDYSTGGNWVNQNSPFGTQQPDTATVGPYGGIFGGDITKTGANQLTVSAFSCLDSTLKIKLYKATATTVAITAAANTIYHLAAVRIAATGVMTVQAYLSEAAIAADATIDAYRWIGEWLTNGATACVEGIMVDGYMLRGKASESVLSAGITTSYATVDHSAQMTVTRVELIEYGARDNGETAGICASIDGTNAAYYIGSSGTLSSDTNENIWGIASSQKTSLKPFNSTVQFKSLSGTLDLLVHQIKYKR